MDGTYENNKKFEMKYTLRRKGIIIFGVNTCDLTLNVFYETTKVKKQTELIVPSP